MICPNKNSASYKLLAKHYSEQEIAEIFIANEYSLPDENEVIKMISNKKSGGVNSSITQEFQKLTAEEKAKTIEEVTKKHRSITALKDLSAKLAWRIGADIQFVNKTDVDWKGYNQGMRSVLNEAYMTPDTPFHEIMGHPIIRALKSMSSQKESITLQQMIDNQEIEKNCN